MVKLILVFAAGAFVGWNVPQPDWAKDAQEAVKDFFAKLNSKE